MADEGYSSAYLPPEAHRPHALLGEPPPDRLGWIMFAGLVLTIVGVVNAIYGVAAVSGSDFYDGNADYIVGNLKVWGWALVILGAAEMGAGYGVWRDAGWGTVLGVACAAVNSIVALLWFPAQPLAALAVYALNLVVLYGLLRYARSPEPAIDSAEAL